MTTMRAGTTGRRVAALICTTLLAALALPASSTAGSGAGYSKPTRILEASFKVALFLRVDSDNGCYPPPGRLARALERRTRFEVTVVTDVRSVRRELVVHVLRRGSSCGRVRLATRYKRGTFVLDSHLGTVRKKGRGDNSAPGRPGPLRAATLATESFRITTPDRAERLMVLCPGRTFPVGGGMINERPLGAGGEGVYPHSYERLGAQRGWHVSAILLDRSRGDTTPRRVTVQALCGRGFFPGRPIPHKSVFVRPGETMTAIARCPAGQYLFSGGFQRTDVGYYGGNYVTESRAAGPRAWRVTAHAHGAFGGELTAIAYCARSGRPLLTEVSGSTPPFGAGEAARATTPRCPSGRRLAVGGFSANGSTDALLAGGYFNSGGTWTASAFGYFGPGPGLTAFGYCLRVKRSG